MNVSTGYLCFDLSRPLKNCFAAAQNLFFAACESFFSGFAKLSYLVLYSSRTRDPCLPLPKILRRFRDSVAFNDDLLHGFNNKGPFLPNA